MLVATTVHHEDTKTTKPLPEDPEMVIFVFFVTS